MIYAYAFVFVLVLLTVIAMLNFYLYVVEILNATVDGDVASRARSNRRSGPVARQHDRHRAAGLPAQRPREELPRRQHGRRNHDRRRDRHGAPVAQETLAEA